MIFGFEYQQRSNGHLFKIRYTGHCFHSKSTIDFNECINPLIFAPSFNKRSFRIINGNWSAGFKVDF